MHESDDKHHLSVLSEACIVHLPGPKDIELQLGVRSRNSDIRKLGKTGLRSKQKLSKIAVSFFAKTVPRNLIHRSMK